MLFWSNGDVSDFTLHMSSVDYLLLLMVQHFNRWRLLGVTWFLLTMCHQIVAWTILVSMLARGLLLWVDVFLALHELVQHILVCTALETIGLASFGRAWSQLCALGARVRPTLSEKERIVIGLSLGIARAIILVSDTCRATLVEYLVEQLVISLTSCGDLVVLILIHCWVALTVAANLVAAFVQLRCVGSTAQFQSGASDLLRLVGRGFALMLQLRLSLRWESMLLNDFRQAGLVWRLGKGRATYLGERLAILSMMAFLLFLWGLAFSSRSERAQAPLSHDHRRIRELVQDWTSSTAASARSAWGSSARGESSTLCSVTASAWLSRAVTSSASLTPTATTWAMVLITVILLGWTRKLRSTVNVQVRFSHKRTATAATWWHVWWSYVWEQSSRIDLLCLAHRMITSCSTWRVAHKRLI